MKTIESNIKVIEEIRKILVISPAPMEIFDFADTSKIFRNNTNEYYVYEDFTAYLALFLNGQKSLLEREIFKIANENKGEYPFLRLYFKIGTERKNKHSYRHEDGSWII